MNLICPKIDFDSSFLEKSSQKDEIINIVEDQSTQTLKIYFNIPKDEYTKSDPIDKNKILYGDDSKPYGNYENNSATLTADELSKLTNEDGVYSFTLTDFYDKILFNYSNKNPFMAPKKTIISTAADRAAADQAAAAQAAADKAAADQMAADKAAAYQTAADKAAADQTAADKPAAEIAAELKTAEEKSANETEEKSAELKAAIDQAAALKSAANQAAAEKAAPGKAGLNNIFGRKEDIKIDIKAKEFNEAMKPQSNKWTPKPELEKKALAAEKKKKDDIDDLLIS